jgi:hypothetical protein
MCGDTKWECPWWELDNSILVEREKNKKSEGEASEVNVSWI